MKKIYCVLMAGMMLLLGGCSGQGGAKAPSPGTSLPGGAILTSDPLLLAATEQLQQGDGTGFAIDAFEVGLEPGQRVITDNELLSAIGEVLVHSSSQPYESQSVSSDGGGHMAIWGNKDPIVSLELFRLVEGRTEPSVNGTLLWLQLGDESASYLLPQEAFDQIEALVKDNIVDNTLSIKGDSRPLNPQPSLQDGYVVNYTETEGLLAALRKVYGEEENGLWLEVLNPETGDSLAALPVEGDAYRMEACQYEAYNLRILLSEGTILYYDIKDITAAGQPHVVTLPTSLATALAAQQESPLWLNLFDIDPATNTAATVSPEGILLKEGSKETLISNQQAVEAMPADFSAEIASTAVFGQVFLPGNGFLAGVVMLPGSQMGDTGLYVRNLKTGQEQWFFDLFYPMMSQLHFTADGAVVLRDTDVVLMNFTTGKRIDEARTDTLTQVFSADGIHLVYWEAGRTADGLEQAVAHIGVRANPLLYATGGLRVDGITDHYLICRSTNTATPMFIICRYR